MTSEKKKGTEFIMGNTMGKGRWTTYSAEEKKLVESGIEAIREVLMGADTGKKLSLLLCLDKYLDPWYGYELSYRDEIISLLEKVIVTSAEHEVIDDALDLLSSYAWGPFPVLEEGLEHIPRELWPDALYVINMHRMAVVEELMNVECLKIYNETRATETAEKYLFCEDAIIVCSSQVNSKMLVYPDKYCDALFQIKDGKVEEIGLPAAGIPYAREPLSGSFFKRAEFYCGIDLDKKECCLIYHFGPRWGRCLVYELLRHGDADYSLGEPKHVWVM